ncbi:carboxylating nicotinate-nucleotide diphosphorylase [Candidatus Aerophobetes bacterium]|uniref:Probable nicotinate-nucleotide pyrophosphorylase [carboxylating] n=1 Tax=Aerophobetes bacterium TaxID=2030807 RepID=A0A662DEL3_UNCAE|nr:MAG: carboxylating nicotinate-nucleotide diphosphorylase [Candidatus Aerophobetes bacterium]
MQINFPSIRQILIDALREDIGEGDITTDTLISSEASFEKARIIANSEGILAGVEIAREIFRLISPQTIFKKWLKDGNVFKQKDILLELEAPARAILKGERVALNFLQRLSGIATLTRKFVDLVSPYGVKILDTRKTTPNLRILEKYAVRVGGGVNHRFNLASGVLIKDNHVRVVGSIKKAVELAKQNAPHLSRVEVEVNNLDELNEVINLEVDGIMLDNFDRHQIKKAIQMIRSKAPKTFIEISGRVTLENIENIASLRPDFISIGKITHSAPSLDMSLEIL